MDWKKGSSRVSYDFCPLVSFLPPLCPLKTSMKEKEQKEDFAVFFLPPLSLREAVFTAFITDRP